MARRDDFTPAEWQLLRQDATSAGLIVCAAQRGGFFVEALALARSFKAAHETDRLIDELVADGPVVEETRFRSAEDLRRRGLDEIRAAIGIIRRGGNREDADAYARFLLAVGEGVARAYRETDEPMTAAEEDALTDIAAAITPYSA